MSNFLPPAVFQIEADASKFHAIIGGVEGELKKLQGITDKSAKGFGGMEKSAQKATGAIRALTVAKALFVAYGVKELMALQQAYNNLGGALANVGLATDANRDKAANLVDSLGKLGFAGDQAANGLATLVTATGNLEKSQRLLGIAANYARAQQVSLADASRAILSAQNGNIKVFKQFGIELDTTVSKSKAVEKAMGELETRLKDRAKNATKDLGVQVAILKNQFMSFVEGIASYVMPWITKFVSGIISATEWLKQNKTALTVVAGVLTTVLLVGIVKVTQALWAQAAAWAAANWQIYAIVAAVVAAAAGFVYLWNKFKGFRDGVISYGKQLLTFWSNIGKMILLFAETAVMAFQLALNAVLLFVRATANAQIAIGKLKNDDEMVKRGKETLDWIDKTNKGIKDFGEKIVAARDKLDKFAKDAIAKLDSVKDFKFDLSSFKLPKFEIPKFTNGQTIPDGIDSEMAKAMAKAEKRVSDFNQKLKTEFTDMMKTWSSIITRDFESEIYAKVGDPIDQVIYEAQTAINAYAAASGKYAAVSANLTSSQNAYIEALKTGNQELIDGAETALSNAESAAQSVSDAMGKALEEVYAMQTKLIERAAQLTEEVSNLEKERTQILKDAQKQRLELEEGYNEEVKRIRRDYTKSVESAEKEAAKRRTEIVQQSIDLLRNAFRQATYKGIGDIYQALTYEGRYIKGGTSEKLLKALGLQTNKAKTLAADAATLAGMGFSQSFIQEVISQGPDVGHQLAQTIINSTPQQVLAMQALWSELQASTLHGVDNVAKTLNVGMNLATEELIAQLKQVDIDLQSSLVEMNKTLEENLVDAFNSYSKSLDAINSRTAEQIIAIDNQINQLNAKIASLKAALSAITGLPAPGTGGGVNIIPRAETSEEEGEASSCESGVGVYKVIKYNGTVMSRTLVRCKPKTTTPPPSASHDDSHQAAGDYTETDTRTPLQKQIDALKLLREGVDKGSALSFKLKEQIDELTDSGVATRAIVDEQSKFAAMRAQAPGTITAGSSFDVGSFRMRENEGMTINIVANTNASAQDIANDVGWAIRTSGDVQYRTPPLSQRGARVDR